MTSVLSAWFDSGRSSPRSRNPSWYQPRLREKEKTRKAKSKSYWRLPLTLHLAGVPRFKSICCTVSHVDSIPASTALRVVPDRPHCQEGISVPASCNREAVLMIHTYSSHLFMGRLDGYKPAPPVMSIVCKLHALQYAKLPPILFRSKSSPVVYPLTHSRTQPS